MKRIKYPSKKEIHRQASVIVDRADIFYDYDEALDFAECRPVRKFRKDIKKVSFCCLAVSGLFVLLFLFRQILPSNLLTNSSALLRVTVDDTIQSESAVTVNEKVTVNYNQKVVYANVRYGDGEESEMVRMECKVPTVSVDGESVGTISDYYEERVKELSTEQVMQYKDENKIVEEVTLVSTQEKNSAVALDTGVQLKYDVKLVTDAADVSTSSNIISFVENFSASTQGLPGEFKESRVYGSNFNVDTGELLTLKDLFTDYEEGSVQLMSAVFSQITRRHSNDLIENSYRSVQELLKNLNESNSWYFGQEGLTICCNGIRKEDFMYPIDDNTYIRITSSESYVVPYSQLAYLKK